MLSRIPIYTPTVMDGAVLRWKADDGCRDEISASRSCVLVRGEFYLRDLLEVERFKCILDDALEAHRRIKSGGHDAALAFVKEEQASAMANRVPLTTGQGDGG